MARVINNKQLGELITFLFINVYQFVAYREAWNQSPNAKSEVHDDVYQLTWLLAGYDGPPSDRDDELTDNGELKLKINVDDELIRAAADAVQTAWRQKNPRVKFPSRLFLSNLEFREHFKIGYPTCRPDYLKIVDVLNSQEIGWRKTLRKTERKKPKRLPAEYGIYVSLENPYICWFQFKGEKSKGRQLTFKKNATAMKAIWNLIIDRFHPRGIHFIGNSNDVNREFTIDDITKALNKDAPQNHKTIEASAVDTDNLTTAIKRNVRTQIKRFNDLFLEQSGLNVDALHSIGRGRYRFTPIVRFETDRSQ